MGKTFYTDLDIEALVKHGTMSITLNDNIVLTDLAYEKARRLGMSLITAKNYQPPAAPVRPYLSKEQKNSSLDLKPVNTPSTFFDEPVNNKNKSSIEQTNPPAQNENTSVGITQLAKRSSDETNIPPGYPVSFSRSKPDISKIQKQIIENVNLRYGKIDENLLTKIIQRALIKAGIQ